MPAPGWKTVALTAQTYDELTELAGWLDRPINWTANKAVDYAIRRCLKPAPTAGDEPDNFTLDASAAEELGLR
jgi:hypothetical protein